MEALPSFLLDYGFPGAALLVVGWYAWNRTRKVDELQERRVDDQKPVADALNDNTNALNALSDLIRSWRGGA